MKKETHLKHHKEIKFTRMITKLFYKVKKLEEAKAQINVRIELRNQMKIRTKRILVHHHTQLIKIHN